MKAKIEKELGFGDEKGVYELVVEIVKELGFKNEKEFYKLVDKVIDVGTLKENPKFKDWQYNDGTKEGLLKLNQKEINNES